MYHNIQKNHNRAGYHGWDVSGHFWKVHKEGPVWFAELRDGRPCFYARTLKGISDKLAVTRTAKGPDGLYCSVS